MSVIKRVILIAWCMCLMLSIEAQLTFSPDWGKRAISNGPGGPLALFETQPNNCKTSNEILTEIFRFIQVQAQQYLDCKHRE